MNDKTKCRGGLAAEGTILKGAPQVKPRDEAPTAEQTPEADSTGRVFIAVVSDKTGKHKDKKRVRTHSFVEALRCMSKEANDGNWLVTATEPDDGRPFDFNVAVTETEKKKRERGPKRPKSERSLYVRELLAKGGMTLEAMAENASAHFAALGVRFRKSKAMKRIRVAIRNMKEEGLEPKWTEAVPVQDPPKPAAAPAPEPKPKKIVKASRQLKKTTKTKKPVAVKKTTVTRK
jgi:hypothetical protein